MPDAMFSSWAKSSKAGFFYSRYLIAPIGFASKRMGLVATLLYPLACAAPKLVARFFAFATGGE